MRKHCQEPGLLKSCRWMVKYACKCLKFWARQVCLSLQFWNPQKDLNLCNNCALSFWCKFAGCVRVSSLAFSLSERGGASLCPTGCITLALRRHFLWNALSSDTPADAASLSYTDCGECRCSLESRKEAKMCFDTRRAVGPRLMRSELVSYGRECSRWREICL